MSGVLEFVKARIIIVILVVLILAMLPTAWFMSSKLNKKIVDAQTQAYQDEKNKIQRASRVTYSLPRISEAEPAESLSLNREPNERVTQWFTAQRAERMEQIDAISGRVIEINSAGHDRLIPEFPPPDDADEAAQRLAVLELARKITGEGRGYDRSAYEILFERMGAGEPPAPEAVAQTVADFEERILAEWESRNAETPVTQAERDDLNTQLVDRRLGEYRRRAREISFYGSAPVVTGEVVDSRGRGFGSGSSSSVSYSQILTEVPQDRPSVAKGYLWQWDYWFIEDILRAITKANTDQAGDPTPVPLSVVKRVDSIRLHAFQIPEGGASDPMSDLGGGGARPVGGASAGPEPETITGRKAGAGPYDIRRAEISVVVSPSRLIALLDAIKSTNLMTVTDLDLQEVDVWEELRQGYFYGDDEYVMRATIGIESVWLRDWTREFMPKPVRSALGITDEAPGVDEEG